MIFISYSWKDKEKIKPIYELLNNYFRQDKVFIDFEKNIQGSNYWKNINNAIKTSQYFLFFNSLNYNNSSSCAKELLLALELEKLNEENFKILEVKLDDTRSHPSLIQKIYKKFTTNEDVFQSIINGITKSDFKGFEKNKLSKIISQKILDDSSFEIGFSINRKIINSKFVLLTEKKSNIEFNVLTKHNQEISNMTNEASKDISVKINGVDLKWSVFREYTTSELFPKLEYKIKISNYDGSKICVLIFDEFLGANYHIIGSYEPIFGYNL